MRLCIRITCDERGGYTALCPCLPGCISYGSTHEEARDKLTDAIRGYIASVSNFVPENLAHQLVEA
ncbi:MAG: type II toxin-antitoxin system HicB family antitoxin [Phycisphaerae bacterium]|nr:type II toxin-antitoxin system HicB family antitoxin [Phycisphaerae bacterium]